MKKKKRGEDEVIVIVEILFWFILNLLLESFFPLCIVMANKKILQGFGLAQSQALKRQHGLVKW